MLSYVELVRYRYDNLRNRKRNLIFQKKNPDFDLPPDHLAFDAHGTIDWESYKISGDNLAKRIVRELEDLDQNLEMVLEWGCGPGRVIRHLPALLNESTIIGSDFNSESIDWCSKHLLDVTFVKNELAPPLPFEKNLFDFIYAISVFTHLSESSCHQWIDELVRIIKPNGILMIWTNGDVISKFMLSEEKQRYSEGEFVVRDRFQEGKKMFLSFHPPKWVRKNLLSRFDILKHYPGGFTGSSQDVWVVRKAV